MNSLKNWEKDEKINTKNKEKEQTTKKLNEFNYPCMMLLSLGNKQMSRILSPNSHLFANGK